MKTYQISLNLTKLKNHIAPLGKNKKRCLILPIEDNCFYESDKGGVFLNGRVTVKEEKDQYDSYGFFGQSVPSDIWKAASEEERKNLNLPILGNLKVFEKEENTGSVDLDTSDVDSNELPF